MKIEINKEDYEFLKDLQHELLTQENVQFLLDITVQFREQTSQR